MSPIIDTWKNSDDVEYTKSGNPKKPCDEVICSWVRQAWDQVSSQTIHNSVRSAGFGERHDWQIFRHDVYGKKFQEKWSKQ